VKDLKARRASSLVFLGLSIILFVISYGIGFLLVAAVLGAFFSASLSVGITDPSWLAMYTRTQSEIKFLVPLVPTIGIFILIIKVLMVASVRGRD
jgi:hypothetical protein